MSEKLKSITAITMGDPAGIGPEVVVGITLDEEIHECCRLFITGSITILDRAIKILGKELRYDRIEDPLEALFQYGAVDVLKTGGYDMDSVRWGEVQELAGRMFVDQTMKSIELGMDHEVDAVSVTPTHKRTTKLAGVKQPGHTRIYQDKIHSPYVLIMSSCHGLRMFFVNHHMSLMDAYEYATKERVLEFVENTDKELRKTGVMEPLIVIATLNPHERDNGLFGTGEIEQLTPAVKAARVEGTNAVGSVPIDSVSHIGKSGKYGVILSLYHDQGHITCKTLDSEKSATLTFGLPLIRSSVDYGTTFDIVGKEIAESISLIESTRVVTECAALMYKRTDR